MCPSVICVYLYREVEGRAPILFLFNIYNLYIISFVFSQNRYKGNTGTDKMLFFITKTQNIGSVKLYMKQPARCRLTDSFVLFVFRVASWEVPINATRCFPSYMVLPGC